MARVTVKAEAGLRVDATSISREVAFALRLMESLFNNHILVSLRPGNLLLEVLLGLLVLALEL